MTPDDLTTPSTDAPFLRTLAPLLRGLESHLRGWLDTKHSFPVPLVARAEIEAATEDLKRKAETLDVEKPLLVVALMGGTGVGKSTLMNALAGAAVAHASFTRPTTKDPVVYFHHSINPDRLDPALRLCRLVQHDRESLEQKVIVDTPDLDSNDIANRDKLLQILPTADVVLYVGSQEKYHDQIGWDIFKQQRRRRAFAFVMNKWDRCQLEPGTAGLRPDEDLLRDLTAEGFESPRLFRTSARSWFEASRDGVETPGDLIEGDQFPLLKAWLEHGITRLEIESVKTRGVGQLLQRTEQALQSVKPPNLTATATKVRDSWRKVVDDEAHEEAEVLMGVLEPYRHEVEHHFSVRGQQRFRGFMAGYLRFTTKLKYAGASLRDRVPFVPKLGASKVETPDDWNLAEFISACARVAEERVLGQRLTAMVNKLLVDAEGKGFSLTLLNPKTDAAAKLDWTERTTRNLTEALSEIEREVAEPTGWRKIVRGGLSLLGNSLPEMVMVGALLHLLWRYFVNETSPELMHALLPIYATLGTLIVLHLLVILILPVRWPAIRSEFRSRLEKKLREEFGTVFLAIPDEVAKTLLEEKRRLEHLAAETRQVADWLKNREQAQQVGELYGK